MPSLNIIGAGRLGRTLGCVWHRNGFFRVGSVCNRNPASASAACKFIGAGAPAESIGAMPDANCWLIATPDGELAAAAAQLGERLRRSSAPSIVFHCSGALSSTLLAPCDPERVASAHPVHSFADPAHSVETLAGTSVAIEGGATALALLRRAFAAIGCETLDLAVENKSLYHAGSVFACNYLSVLMDISLLSFAAAGIPRAEALKLLKPIVEQTAQNNMRLGPEASLTGPIVRGDVETVSTQLRALEKVDTTLAEHYRRLGLACVGLARRSGLPEGDAERMVKVFSEAQL
ncbi:Rossmann-like and DUF2520 domain-containing protein [Microbulbifer sp. 2201CG32-9]|uniref:Rossmann-like and DUF2520 domain-containing protein n=1 Tax=Microbulbifer sp. 2201CG32-9 TaxID=3232309 RepID=UPI00345BF73B